jgi:hypothetical protein
MGECERLKQLIIPKNDKNICWWLSVNLALFHKQRPEFDAVFNGGGDYVDQFREIYTYYSGRAFAGSAPGPGPILDRLTNEIREVLAKTDAAPPTAATAATPNSGKSKELPFSINSGKYESVTEYFQYIINKLGKFNHPLDELFIPIINGNYHSFEQAYDIYYHSLYFGLRRQVDDKNPIKLEGAGIRAFYEFPKPIISHETVTIVLSFERKLQEKYSNYTINPLEKMTLPTATTTKGIDAKYTKADEGLKGLNTMEAKEREELVHRTWSTLCNEIREQTVATEFELDAMTVSSPGGGHFVTYIKCGDEWIYDNGLSQGPLGEKDGTRTFPSFADMMNDETHGKLIRENLLLLYYSNLKPPTQ